MKSKIIFFYTLFVSAIFFSQSKVGTIDSEFIIGSMPEAKIVVKRAQYYGAKLDSSFQVKVKVYQEKVENYEKNKATLGELAKKTTIQEIAGLEADIKKYQSNGQKLMQLKENELMRPLYKKLNDAIAEVSKSNGFTQILTVTGNQFAYIDPRFDITELVINKLGIKVTTTADKK